MYGYIRINMKYSNIKHIILMIHKIVTVVLYFIVPNNIFGRINRLSESNKKFRQARNPGDVADIIW